MQDAIIKNPHDSIFKTFLEKTEIARDFIIEHVPEKFKSHMDFSTLFLESGSFISDTLRQTYADVLYSVKSNRGSDCYIYFLLEHQSTPDPLMPFRLLSYSLNVMHRHLENEKKKSGKKCTKLPLVVPLVFYQGPEGYNYSMEFLKCFADEGLAEKLYKEPFQLVDLTKFDNDDLKKHPKRVALLELVQKNIKIADMNELAGTLGEVLHDSGLSDTLFQQMMFYINECGYVSDGAGFLNTIIGNNPNYEDETMKLMQPFIDKGRQQGLLQGIEQGVQEEKCLIAKQMLIDQLDQEKIKKYTGLTDAKLAQLTQSMNTMSDAEASGSMDLATASNQEFGSFAHVNKAARDQ